MSLNKIRTVIYAEPGARSFVERLVAVEGFKSESDAFGYIIALGMQAHTKKNIEEKNDAHS